MALWSNTDANTSAPIFVGSQVNVAPTAENRNLLYANTTTSAYITGAKVGVFGVDTTEVNLANNALQHPTHSGWVLRTEGTGGRSGRVQTEVLVAMGSMLSTSDGSASANDDTVYVDA